MLLRSVCDTLVLHLLANVLAADSKAQQALCIWLGQHKCLYKTQQQMQGQHLCCQAATIKQSKAVRCEAGQDSTLPAGLTFPAAYIPAAFCPT